MSNSYVKIYIIGNLDILHTMGIPLVYLYIYIYVKTHITHIYIYNINGLYPTQYV